MPSTDIMLILAVPIALWACTWSVNHAFAITALDGCELSVSHSGRLYSQIKSPQHSSARPTTPAAVFSHHKFLAMQFQKKIPIKLSHHYKHASLFNLNTEITFNPFNLSLSAFHVLGPLAHYGFICRASPNTFVHLVGNGKFWMGFLNGAFEEHGFLSYLCNFLWISWLVVYLIRFNSNSDISCLNNMWIFNNRNCCYHRNITNRRFLEEGNMFDLKTENCEEVEELSS